MNKILIGILCSRIILRISIPDISPILLFIIIRLGLFLSINPRHSRPELAIPLTTKLPVEVRMLLIPSANNI